MATSPTDNEAQRNLWNGPSGQSWVAAQSVLDQMFAPFEAILLEVVAREGPGPLLDIGCGTGATTLAAARLAGAGRRCNGLDISQPMIDLARERAAREGLDVTFLCADAQSAAFEPASYRLVVSRFGVMFFDDPVRAFTNLYRATQPGGAMRVIAWRSPQDNPFMTAAERAVRPLLPDMPARDPEAPGQFAFADKARVEAILDGAGWSDVTIAPIHVACSIAQADLDLYLTRLGPLGLILPQLDTALRAQVTDAARAAMAGFIRDGRVQFTAACWQIDARA